MASEEFVEEFDSDDDDEQFSQQTQAPFFAPYNPLLYISELTTPSYNFQRLPPPVPPPPHTVSKQSKQRRKRREKVKLTEYNESIKSHAWKTCQLFSLQKSLNIIKLDKGESAEEQRKIVEKIEAIKKDLNSSDATTFSSSDQSDLRKLVNKFKSQRAKREREKSQRKVKSDEKSSNKVKAEEIDKWQKEQTTIHDKQRQHELFVQNSKKSLAQVKSQKERLEDKIKLISSLEKLREVRRKKLINVQSGFASQAESIARSSRKFETGIYASKRKLEFVLQRLLKDEEKILFMMKESEQELSELLVHKTTQSESGVANCEMSKMKRDRKWKKYLHKKMCNYY